MSDLPLAKDSEEMLRLRPEPGRLALEVLVANPLQDVADDAGSRNEDGPLVGL